MPLTDLRPELLTGYTIQQLSDALAAVLMADVQNFNAEVRKTVALSDRMSGDAKGFPFVPRLSADFEAAVHATLAACQALVIEGHRLVQARNDLLFKSAQVTALYREYETEVKAVLDAIENTPAE